VVERRRTRTRRRKRRRRRRRERGGSSGIPWQERLLVCVAGAEKADRERRRRRPMPPVDRVAALDAARRLGGGDSRGQGGGRSKR
jgi:hypothetical protein